MYRYFVLEIFLLDKSKINMQSCMI